MPLKRGYMLEKGVIKAGEENLQDSHLIQSP